MNNELIDAFKIIAAQIGRLCAILVKLGILTKEEVFWVINGDDDDQLNTPKGENNGKR